MPAPVHTLPVVPHRQQTQGALWSVHLYILFVSQSFRPMRGRWGGIFAMARRRPAWFRQVSACFLTRSLSGSNLVHVSVGDGHAVLSPNLAGDRFHPFDQYVLTAHRLTWMLEVPCPAPASLAAIADARPKPILPAIVSRFTRGIVPARTCVTTARQALAAGEISVPRRVTTPVALFDWLRQQGFTLHDLADDDQDRRLPERQDRGMGRPAPGSSARGRANPCRQHRAGERSAAHP